MTDEMYPTTPPTNTAPVTPAPEPVTPPTPTPDPVTPPPADSIPYIPSKSSSAGPFFFGLFLVLLVAGALGFLYYQRFISPAASPAPSPSASPSPSAVSSPLPSSTPLSTRKPSATPKPSPIATPTSTPTPLTNFDIRFGNPSANVKQTYDDGSGAGRVINREFTSIQAGQFDELKSSWNPRVTICFHVVSNEEVPGKNIKFSFALDDKVEVEDTLSQYDKLEAGRIYDWCHDVTTSIGKHTGKMLLNGDKSVKEGNYVNDLGRIDYENLADNVPPNYVLTGPFDWNESGTCLLTHSISDNINTLAELKIEQKIDSADWVTFSSGQYCFQGTSGSSHTYAVRITDTRGNKNEQSKTFPLF